MKHFTVSDIHGFYAYLIKALTEAGFFEETEPCKVVVCGDLLDRGKEAKALVDFMMRLLEEDRLIFIRGNHEDLFTQCLQEISHGGVYEIACGMSHHYRNGTFDTLLQLADMDEVTAVRRPHALVNTVMQSPFYKKLLSACVDYYETPHYVFTHGYIPCPAQGYKPFVNYRYDPNWRSADTEAWNKARWLNGMDLACKHHITEPGKTIVAGHWHASYGHAKIAGTHPEWGEGADFTPFRAEGILAIDSCASASDFVNCVVIED